MYTEKLIPLKIPDIGENDAIELIEWLVRAGEQVTADQALCELVTAKAAFQLESPCDGTVTEINKPAGTLVTIGEVVAQLQPC